MIDGKRDEPVATPEERAVELLQSFYDETMTEEESLELLDIWAVSPQAAGEARNSFLTESAFRFVRDSRQHLSPERLEQLRNTFKNRMGLPAGSTATQFPDFDELTHLETESSRDTDWSALIRMATETPTLHHEEERTQDVSIPSVAAKQAKPLAPLSSKEIARNRIFFAVIAVMIVFAICHEFFLASTAKAPAEKPFVPLATITRIADFDLATGFSLLRQGQGFEAELIDLPVPGLVELELSNGIRVVLEGPAKYHLHSPEKTFCESGRVSVRVPKGREGFEVGTPYLDVRDLGTEFVVDVAENNTEVHVISGKVETNRLAKDWIPLEEGRGLLSRSDATVKQIPADSSRYVSEKTMEHRAEKFAAILRETHESMIRHDSEDSSLILRLSFDETSPHAMRAKQVEGRYAPLQAVEFRDVNDAVEIDADGSYYKLTLLATARLDGLVRACNTILATEGFTDEPGFCWNIEGSGAVQFQFMEPESNIAKIYESRPCITPKRLGTWIDLALSIDTEKGEVVHYLNGAPVATVPIKTNAPVTLGRMTLGNWLRSGHNPKGRQFHGRIDSLALFARVLSPEEIASKSLP